jgi:RimJ/RimL family protein N-acetyltransferase
MEIVTDRLLIRPPDPADAEAALEMLLDPECIRWNPVPEVVDLDTACAWCERNADWSSGDHTTWHATDRLTGRFHGIVSVFAIDGIHLTAKVGYRIAPGSRRRGYGREALAAVTAWAFTERGLARIQIEHEVDNLGSCGVALGAGYRLEGVLRSSYSEPDGQRHDEHVHGRLATDPTPDPTG